ncbi:MAG: phosphoribosylglycinamide formyltransferase 2, partial [Chromatocurvus sp.]
VEGNSIDIRYGNLAAALAEPDTDLRLFGKPEVRGERRMGVALALGENTADAVEKALGVIGRLEVALR